MHARQEWLMLDGLKNAYFPKDVLGLIGRIRPLTLMPVMNALLDAWGLEPPYNKNMAKQVKAGSCGFDVRVGCSVSDRARPVE